MSPDVLTKMVIVCWWRNVIESFCPGNVMPAEKGLASCLNVAVRKTQLKILFKCFVHWSVKLTVSWGLYEARQIRTVAHETLLNVSGNVKCDTH